MRNAAPKIYGFIQENPWFRSNRKDCIFRKTSAKKVSNRPKSLKIHAVYSIIIYNCTIAEKEGGMGRMIIIKKSFTNPKSIYAILLLGIFTFLFLGAEYLYVNMISLTAGEEKTVIAQNYA